MKRNVSKLLHMDKCLLRVREEGTHLADLDQQIGQHESSDEEGANEHFPAVKDAAPSTVGNDHDDSTVDAYERFAT